MNHQHELKANEEMLINTVSFFSLKGKTTLVFVFISIKMRKRMLLTSAQVISSLLRIETPHSCREPAQKKHD